jgi:hypothetical protein
MLALATWLLASPAAADDLSECFDKHEEAQQLRQGGKILAARDELDVCTRAVCPEPVRQDCSLWLDELNAAQPTLVVVARDAKDGATMRDVRLWIDDAAVAEQLTGTSLPVDPGERKLRLQARDGRVMETKLLIVEGDKGRRVVVTFPAPAPPRPAPEPPPKAPHPTVWVFTALGVAGLVGFGVLAGVGYAKEQDYAEECAPNCSEDQIDEVQRLYIAGDVLGAFGVVCGVVALSVGLWGAYGDSSSARLRLSPTSAQLEARW